METIDWKKQEPKVLLCVNKNLWECIQGAHNERWKWGDENPDGS